MLRIEKDAFVSPEMLIALVFAIAGLAMIAMGAMRANDGCFASGAYWVAGGVFVLGIGGTAAIKTPWGFAISGSTAGVIALAGWVAGTFFGGC